jgi:dTDP-4-amino-4,6-dideoxygalactose transaminase
MTTRTAKGAPRVSDSIPFLDLKAQYRSIEADVRQAIDSVLASSAYVLGPEVALFEEEFAELHEASYGIAVNSGTSALHVALLAADVGPGDEVITVSMSFIATAAAIRYVGATPVFVDVDPISHTIDVSQVEASITPRTRAIVPVHLYGQAADMGPLMRIAESHGLAVIEDAAQAHLAEYEGRRVGSLGHAAAFSFYPGKNLGAYGEGGMAVTNDAAYADRMRRLRDWGQAKKYHHDVLGFNYRMDAIQGAILRVKLRHLEAWTDRRRAHAARYRERLLDSGIRVAGEVVGRKHVYHIFSAFHRNRNGLQESLRSAGVHTGIHYPVPIHLQTPFSDPSFRRSELPATERLAREQLSLPMFPELKDEQIERVADLLKRWAEAADRDLAPVS